MSIVLVSSGGGQITLEEPTTASNFTQTLPAATGTVALTNAPVFTGQATIPTINLTGGQITFPATQSASSDANTLDDYEEGTFTPSISNGVTSPVYSEQTAAYTKIGRFVSFSVRIEFTSGTGNGAQVQLSGLPFTSSSATGVRGTATGAYLDASALVLAADISTATTTIACYQYGGSNYIFSGSLANKYFYICGSYYTD